MTGDRFDYVVVGAGSAGSVVAGRLSENCQDRVCVLEAGPTDRSLLIHVPAAVVYALNDPRINWMFRTAPSWGTAGRSIIQSRGKTLGGSGSINGHVYTRGHRSDFDTWAEMGNRGWSYQDILPFFKRSERRIGPGDDTYRGREGPFTITDIEETDLLSDAFIETAKSLGIPQNPDYNGASQDGIAYVQRSIAKGRRVSPARAFLYPAMKRGNTDVRTNARALQILFEGKRAIGVRYLRHGREEVVVASKEVILSCGAIGSPHLLQVSGIGNPQLLRGIGVEVVHALSGVGENLRDHYAARMVMRIKGIGTINERTHGLNLFKEIMRYALTAARRPSSHSDAGLLLLEIRRTARSRRYPDLLHPGKLSLRCLVGARPPPRSHDCGMAATASERRLRTCAVRRSARGARIPAKLPGRGRGPPSDNRCHATWPPDRCRTSLRAFCRR